MDHREQMQKEAEQWQGTAVKIIQRFRYGIAAVAVLGLLILFVRNLGFPRQIDESYTASVITENGQMLECIVELRGEITEYPLNKDKSGVEDHAVVYANGTRVLTVSFHGDKSRGFLVTQNHRAVCVLSVDRKTMFLETDVMHLIPDMESQRCLVFYGQESFDLPGEYAELFTLLKK